MREKPLFVTGTGTGVGKTIVSAVLCQQLDCDYWKPVQAGDLNCTDSDMIRELVSKEGLYVHLETYQLELAASPHESAFAEGIEIDPKYLKMPFTRNRLLIEGAGGLFVPITKRFLMTDLIQQVKAEVVLVTKDYLGTINHTLMSIYVIRHLDIPLKHIVFNGEFNPHSKSVIISHLPKGTTWSELPELSSLTKNTIASAPMQIFNY